MLRVVLGHCSLRQAVKHSGVTALRGWPRSVGVSKVGLDSVTPLRGLEGVPGLPGAPQDEAGLTRKFETSHMGGATCRTPPMRSQLLSHV